MCIWCGLSIYELFHSESCLNSKFLLEWEAQSEFFLVIYPRLFSRLLHFSYFPLFVNHVMLYEDAIYFIESFWLERNFKGHLVEHPCHVQGSLARAGDLALCPF